MSAQAQPMLGLPLAELDRLMPLHLRLDPGGRICGAGPSLQKVAGGSGALIGRPFEAKFEILRPERFDGIGDLALCPRLRLRFRAEEGTWFKGVAVPLPGAGVLLNLSFGFGLHEAVRAHGLSDTDFAVTDLAVEFLYLVEAKEAVFTEARTFSRRLHGARDHAREQALTDPLTGLHNRRGLDRTLLRLSGGGTGFGLIHIDLDRFKAINDTLGHAIGDQVLVETGRRLQSAVRDGDGVARIGGDEFIVILAGVQDGAGLAVIAGRIAEDLKRPVAAGELAVPVSASLGAVLCDGRGGADIDSLLLAADQALYRSKDDGRGRVTLAAPIESARIETGGSDPPGADRLPG